MSKFTRFEDLICWQKARKLVHTSLSNNKVSEPISEYGISQNSFDILDEFVTREHLNT